MPDQKIEGAVTSDVEFGADVMKRADQATLLARCIVHRAAHPSRAVVDVAETCSRASLKAIDLKRVLPGDKLLFRHLISPTRLPRVIRAAQHRSHDRGFATGYPPSSYWAAAVARSGMGFEPLRANHG